MRVRLAHTVHAHTAMCACVHTSTHLLRLPVVARIGFKTVALAYKKSTKGPSAESQLLSVVGPRWWNELPADVRTAESLTTTCPRKRLKTHLFRVHLDYHTAIQSLICRFALFCLLYVLALNESTERTLCSFIVLDCVVHARCVACA